MPIASDGNGNYLTLGNDGQWAPAQRAKHPETGAEVILDGSKWKPLSEIQGGQANAGAATGDSFVRSIAQGASLGFADEIAAGGDALIGHVFGRGSQAGSLSERYNENLALERGRDTAAVASAPVSNVVGNVVGGIGGAVASGPVLAATGLTRGAAAIAGPVNSLLGRIPGAALAGRVAAPVAGGAVAGAGAGFGEGQGGFGARLENAGEGALIGGAAGGVIGAGVRVGAGVIGRAGHALGLRNPEVAADRHILRALDRSGVTPDAAEASLAAAGDAPLALVDVGGRNTVNLGRVAANTPGEAVEAADKFVQGRRGSRPDRLMNAGDAAFGGGSGDDVAQTLERLRTQRTNDASPLYEQAFGREANYNDAMRGVMEDPITRAGLARGLEIQRIENTTRRARGEDVVPTTDRSIDFDELGVPRIIDVPNMRTLDAVKRGLDATIEDARDATTGKIQWTERLRAIDDLRQTWVGLLDKNNPTYAQARAAWGGPSSQMEALGAGRQALRADRDVVAGRMANAPPDVQEAYRLGAGRDFSDRVSNPARASGAATNMLEDRQMQARFNALLPPEALQNLNGVLRREADMTAVERAVSPRAGSQTGALMAGGEDLARDPMGPWANALMQATSGRFVQAAGTAAQDIWRRAGQGINPATSDALANRLFSIDPAARSAVIANLRARQVNDLMRAQRARAVINPALQGTGAGLGLLSD